MLTIAILNYNGKDYLEDCLRSIGNIEAERILVDNASMDGSWKIAEKYGFRVAHASNKHKFLTGINRALTEATGNHILFSQGDVKFTHGAIESLQRYIGWYDHGLPAIIQPVFLKNGVIDNAGMEFVWPAYGAGDLSLGDKSLKPTTIATSITFIVSRKVLDMVGMYDTSFAPAYYEDVDYALRCRKVGVRQIVCTEAFVNHRHNESFSKEYDKFGISEICRKNRQYLVRKHYRGIDKWMRLAALGILDGTNRAVQFANKKVGALGSRKTSQVCKCDGIVLCRCVP